MKIKTLVSLSVLSAALVACGGGDIEIDAQNNSTTTTTTNNNGSSGGGTTTPTNNCASYVRGGQTIAGQPDGANCVYGTDFSDLTNPIVTDPTTQITFSNLPTDGVHIFRGSLVVGQSFNTDADLTNAGLTAGGTGSVIRLEAGATLAFRTSDDYMVINRGSQIFAEGTQQNPITITSVSDAVDGTVTPEAVQEWGGMIINGFGVTNKCAYTGNRGDAGFALAGECHVAAEGRSGSAQTFYGGANDADNSGVLRYFIVKHTGAEVAPGNELNGISFNAVGSGTEVSYLEAYSTFDDGIEFFGGAVNVDHYIGLYVRDDSIDIDEGYRGTIDYALVIQSEGDGNRCMESDGIGSYSSQTQATIDDFIARGLNSAATVRNVTCIVSPSALRADLATAMQDEALGTATHDPGQGFRIREAHFPTIENAIVTTAYAGDVLTGDDDYNYCVRIDDEGQQAAIDGTLTLSSSIVACQDLIDGELAGGASTLDWINNNGGNITRQTPETGEDPEAGTAPDLVILDSFYSLAITDTMINGAAANATITPTESRTFIGAVTRADDWTEGWAFGLADGNRGQALWIDQ
ncbi:serine/threonine protein kinase [Agarilytica rhodophyticola]|uniref:serine/threonine protein kinase n=1 Tax=Agarilytica rhodophyticola TaxID=1737490 RepID=UPI000B343BAE|nr:serine/threonine protein kinase [Agarilytica rhodophyticola]